MSAPAPSVERSVVVGTAGHIDHGKSALVQALTGTDPDRLKEEKARGITIDLGFAHAVINGVTFAFVDVPGHERFVKNMLAGVGGLDLVALVIAADESIMPQTREHFDICRLLRVPAGLVVLTKADIVDADTLELVRLEARELVAGSFLEAAPVVPVSARTGQGLGALRAALVDAARRAVARPSGGAVRLPIDRVFSMKGFGTVVTGTLVSGRIAADDQLAIAPGGQRVKVRGVQVHGVRRDAACAGQRVAVNLGGVEVADLARGQTLIAPESLEETQLTDAVLDVLPGAGPLKDGARVRFHQGTAEILGRVALVGPRAQPGVAGSLTQGARGFVRLRLERPAVLTRGDRFILRAYSPPVTIAGGRIIDPRPTRTGLRSLAMAERCGRLDFDDARAELPAIALLVEEAGGAGLPAADLVSRAGIAPPAVEAALEALAVRHAVVRVGDTLVTRALLDRVMHAVVDLLAQHHAASPRSEGMPREEVRERLFARGHAAVFERALEELHRSAQIVGRDRLALAGHRLVSSPEEERARAVIEAAFRDAGLKPPDPAAAASAAGLSPEAADGALRGLVREKALVRIGELVFHEEALERLKQEVAALGRAEGPKSRIDVATFKERFGVTRKFAIPLLEYLDRERVTRRAGDTRIIL